MKPTPPPPPAEPRMPATPPRIDSAQLFGNAQELHIEHRGELYRLRKTAQGKLILTK